MRRALGLLLVAVLSGTVALRVSTARADKRPASSPGRLAPASSHPDAPCPVPARFRAPFQRASAETNLPMAMLVAVARVESRLEPDARSQAGARGLLQLMPSTAVWLDLDPDEPESNILAGARYLRLLLDEFHSADLALAAYNAEPTAVARAGQAPTGQTLVYVANVTRLWRAYLGCS